VGDDDGMGCALVAIGVALIAVDLTRVAGSYVLAVVKDGGRSSLSGYAGAGCAILVIGIVKAVWSASRRKPDDARQDPDAEAQAVVSATLHVAGADRTVEPAEMAAMQTVLRRDLGIDMRADDVARMVHRLAVHPGACREVLREMEPRLDGEAKHRLLSAVAAVIRADGTVTSAETMRFHEIARVLEIDWQDPL
jgi:uncharacterized tellurite resistance protein B-like protein